MVSMRSIETLSLRPLTVRTVSARTSTSKADSADSTAPAVFHSNAGIRRGMGKEPNAFSAAPASPTTSARNLVQ